MRVAVLASGSGTILEAILERGSRSRSWWPTGRAARSTSPRRRPSPRCSSSAASFGKDFDRDAYTGQIVDVLDKYDIELVVMAGWGTIFGPGMFDAYDGRILNTHPALLPAFKGWHAVREALAAGVKVTGCTVHIATAEVDDGPILAQQRRSRCCRATRRTRCTSASKKSNASSTSDTIKTIVERGSVQ